MVQDAAPELWTLVRTALRTHARLRRWHEAVDRYYLTERLAAILRGVEPAASRRQPQLRRWNHALDRDDRAIDRIVRWIAPALEAADATTRATLEEHWTYLVQQNARMRYATLRRAGLPCGSGATEAACKSVVTLRTKRSGQRWHHPGATAALTLRALHLSERLPALWSHFSGEYFTDVQAAA